MKVTAIFSFLLAIVAYAESARTRPNIIVILSDDMGFSDIGCYGGEIATPALDALAKGGIRFTQFYNTARCCPTRASLLTGLYPHQAGIGHMTDDRGYDGYRGDLNRRCASIAEVLRPAGYRNYVVGKWHVTKALQAMAESEKHNWPLQRGFDRFYGTIIGGGSFWDPAFLTRDNTQVSAHADADYRPQEPYYYTDAISDHAARFVREHAAEHGERPFFLYVAYTAAHWPMHARERDIAKYKGRYDAGCDAIRRERYDRMVQLGVVKKDATRVLPVPAQEKEFSEWDARNMETYAAMVDSMDQGIARIVAAVKATGQFENTLICYMQDNGGCAETLGRKRDGDPARAAAPSLPPQAPELLSTELVPKQTRDGFPVRQGRGVMAGPADTYIAYGEAWAAVSNTPFREYKHWVHEGGISTPLIVHWPRGIELGRVGQMEHTPGHLVDIMATCMDIAGAAYPAGKKPLQGRSLAPHFRAAFEAPVRALFWEHEGNRAVREGDWKVVAKENAPWELYNIAADRSELRNLAAEQPDRVRELAVKWDAYADASDVRPLGAWRERKNARAGKLRFELKAGDVLEKGDAPGIEGRAFRVDAAFTAPENAAGVVVAQGGSAHGWSLHAGGGELYFSVRRGGGLETISRPLAAGARAATARVDIGGAISLEVDGIPTAGKRGPLLQMPVDGLQVGRDTGGLVGDYSDANTFNGTVERVVVEIGSALK